MVRQERIKQLVGTSPFLRNNTVFFLGSLVVSVLNYLFYPILSRLLAPAQFGEVQAILSLYAQGAIFLTILTFVTIHVTVNTEDVEQRNRILLSLERYALFTGLGMLAVGLLLVGQLKEFLNFQEVLPFVVLIFTLALSIPLSFRMAYLRARKHYVKAIATDASGSLGKLIIAPVLVMLGAGTFGAILGLALSQVLSLALGFAWAYRAGLKGFGLRSSHTSLALIRPQMRYALVVFLSTSVIMALFSLDIIAIKHYFNPEQAGLYAGVSTIAKTVFFVTAPITGVLITMVSLAQPASKNRLQYLGSVGLITLIGSLTLGFISLFPEFVIRILVGGNYLTYAYLLPRLGLAMLLLSVANASLAYNIALKRYAAAFLAALVLALTIGLLVAGSASIEGIVNGLLAGSSGLLILVGGFTLLTSGITMRGAYGKS